MQLYLIYFGIGLLGMAFQVLLKMQALQTLAKKANVIFKPSSYFSDDWISLSLSLLTIIICMVFLPDIEKNYPAVSGWMRISFAFVGYTGASILNRIFSVANSKLNAAIDYKTTISDTETGTLGAPTPAAPEKK
jgi:hypothetical protein